MMIVRLSDIAKLGLKIVRRKALIRVTSMVISAMYVIMDAIECREDASRDASAKIFCKKKQANKLR